MTPHLGDRVSELLLGQVSDDERAAMEAHVADCERCARELSQAADAFATLALALPAEAPPPSLRSRLLDAATPPRLAHMVERVAGLFDVTRQRARALLDTIDDPSVWLPGPVDASWILPVERCGPKTEGAFCGFVKMGASVRWPPHRHLGREFMMVLEGGFRQHDGVEVHAGDVHVMEEGSVHDFTIFGDEHCLAAAVLFGGIAFDDPSLTLSGSAH